MGKPIAEHDRRKAQRLDIHLNIEQRLFRGGEVIKTVSRDISGSGLRVQLRNSLKKGDKLKTVIHFPVDRHPVTAVSEVIWCKKRLVAGKKIFDAGVKYLEILPKDRDRFVFLFCETMINYFMRNSLKVI